MKFDKRTLIQNKNKKIKKVGSQSNLE